MSRFYTENLPYYFFLLLLFCLWCCWRFFTSLHATLFTNFILFVKQYHPLGHFKEFGASPTQNAIDVDLLVKIELIKYILNQLPVSEAVVFILGVVLDAAFVEQI